MVGSSIVYFLVTQIFHWNCKTPQTPTGCRRFTVSHISSLAVMPSCIFAYPLKRQKKYGQHKKTSTEHNVKNHNVKIKNVKRLQVKTKMVTIHNRSLTFCPRNKQRHGNNSVLLQICAKYAYRRTSFYLKNV